MNTVEYFGGHSASDRVLVAHRALRASIRCGFPFSLCYRLQEFTFCICTIVSVYFISGPLCRHMAPTTVAIILQSFTRIRGVIQVAEHDGTIY